MVLLDGRDIKKKVLEDMREKVSKLDRKLTLAVISTTCDDSCKVYMENKRKMCESVSYDFRYFDCSSMEEEEIILKITELNSYDDIDGILVQLPIRENLDSEKIIQTINYKKDVDGITDMNMGKLVNGDPYLCSCTSLGIVRLLEEYSIDVALKNVVIIGRSRLVGKQLANMFLNMDATVTLCHSKTKNLEFYTKNADIIVVAVGIPEFLRGNMIKDDCVVIDVGINKLDDGSIVGDVCFDEVRDKASFITPVPYGVGQMTVAMLCENIYYAYLKRNNLF